MRRLVLALSTAAALSAAGAAARADTGTLLGLATDVRSGHGLALIGDDPRFDGEFAVRAQPLAADGRLTGSASPIADTVRSPYDDHVAVAAYDPARRDWLVAWAGRAPGMASAPCPPPPPGPVAPPPGDCRLYDEEIFVRLVGADGAPLGPARRISTTGPESSTRFFATSPSLVHERGGGFLVAWVAAATGDDNYGALFDEALGPDGAPRGGQRRLRVRRAAASVRPLLRLVPEGRGALLVFTWARRPNDWRAYAARLDARGRPGRAAAVATGSAHVGLDDVVPAIGRPRVLLLWYPTVAGSYAGFRAQRLTLAGRRAGPVHVLPLREGSGPIAAAADRGGAGWLLAGGVERTHGGMAQAAVLRAGPDGRARGRPHQVSHAAAPARDFLAATLRAGHVVGWSTPPFGIPPAPGQFSLLTVR